MRVNEPRPLGRTSVRTTAMSFGAAPIGNFLRPFSESMAMDMVSQAWDLGMRHFDTAPLYGHGLSEHRLGHALRGYPRDQYVISTKVGRRLKPAALGTFDSGLWVEPAPFAAHYDYSYDGIMRSVEESLQRMLTDHRRHCADARRGSLHPRRRPAGDVPPGGRGGISRPGPAA
ncbi:aldo/keto reductase [Streptomyces sp. NPDC007875]|uniref:aldo/keto reductase n=1 Tax=Streptomyces sp. NPDC007875 TaxID=3364783 RepID=UPI0036C85D14